MAGTIVFDNSTGASNVTATSLTYSHTVGSNNNRILFVGYGCETAGAVTGITYAGQAMTRVGSELNGLGGIIGMFYLLNPTSGANNVVVSLNASKYVYSACASYSGARQSSQPDSSNTRSASITTSGNVSTTIVTKNSWTVMFAIAAANSAIIEGTNCKLRSNTVNNERGIFDSNGSLSSGSQTMSCSTASGVLWSEIIVSFKPLSPVNRSMFI